MRRIIRVGAARGQVQASRSHLGMSSQQKNENKKPATIKYKLHFGIKSATIQINSN